MPPGSQPTATATAVTSFTASEKAWHLLALLISLGGRPVRATELASRCTLFPVSPEFVEFLCSIPNSPLCLTPDLYITVSPSGLFSSSQFLFNSNLTRVFLPKIEAVLPRRFCDTVLRTYLRKRKRKDLDFDLAYVNEEEQMVASSSKRIRKHCRELSFHIDDCINKSKELRPSDASSIRIVPIARPSLLNCNPGSFSSEIENYGPRQVEVNMNEFIQSILAKNPITFGSYLKQSLSSRVLGDHLLCVGAKSDDMYPRSGTDAHEIFPQDVSRSMEAEHIKDTCQEINVTANEGNKAISDRDEKLIKLSDDVTLVVPSENETSKISKEKAHEKMLPFSRLSKYIPVQTQTMHETAGSSATNNDQLAKLVKTKKTHRQATTLRIDDISKTSQHHKSVSTCRDKQHVKQDPLPLKLKQNQNAMPPKMQKENSDSISPKDHQKQKILPDFQSFVIEEEEGSGGYGTVYRARRKSDGHTVAIKCPHPNAHQHYVNNELKMLERFGGKNFIIKYEGSFKSGDSDCFVLEHVKHDRPEVLKKDIDVLHLIWYGYCMFRALASLHRQGVVHRDVKPGNFLFSRKANKGYLIDFNLAMDLNQKYGSTSKLKVAHDTGLIHAKLSPVKAALPTESRKLGNAKTLDSFNSKLNLVSKNPKKKAVDQTKAQDDLGGWKVLKSQGAEGSGITSAKDVTSTRTPSAERRKEPLPCQGRKELLNLLQEAMQNPKNEASRIPAPMRKRVAAPPGKVDRKLVYLTPMPVHSTGIAIAGAGPGLVKNRGNGKHKKEGPCVGTKGFRAPEVLFRSQHQGPKVDVWSAGVTLLYLMIGRAPFFGDPEQNVREIAKLRGSEDLWEVAKIHNCESSFPLDLYDAKFLPSLKLRDWCERNTKRPNFLDIIPSSLFDLVDKCLTVNPRLRITAEEALKHEFFAPCHEGLRRQRLLRQGMSSESGRGDPFVGQNVIKDVEISLAEI